jgi:hypothetical protein
VFVMIMGTDMVVLTFYTIFSVYVTVKDLKSIITCSL